ncbi:MAG: ABC-F family ATP-binding cassette domain-containing protein [Acidobacteria bacterium]|nr:ABC-F family ATP-binding cassette domain-containing protein [Acidobacteriota bacterium]
MIQLSGAGKRYGHKLLFENLDWLITPQDRIGLVGANGTGKSTLLKILAGSETLDYGAVTAARGITAGYLPQDGLQLSGRTVFEECLSVFSDLQQMEREIEQLTGSLADLDHEGPEYAAAADRLHRLEGEFRARDGYAIEAQAGAVLSGLGFGKADWSRLTDEFSGGWQMRIALARLLLKKPNLLLLDEPTNHLDLETRNWLEQYLAGYPHAYILISHDRYFLDVTVRKTIEIWNKAVHFYSGNYEKYLREKTERRAQIEAAYRNQRERIEQLEAFINRFRYQATKAKQVQSRIKELEKIERIEIPREEREIHFKFPQPTPSGRLVAECRDVAKSYGAKLVFRRVNFTIDRGDRVALVGVNGAGKSTLMKILAGLEPASQGHFRLGHNVEPEYFAQDQYKVLDAEARMLDDLWNLAPSHTQTELRSLLGAFLFSEDDVFKKLGVLSGGERNRYALARILLHPSNFLLLDEPTNHLDLRAKDVLLEALQDYSGTVVFISHDRYFIDKLATRIIEIADGAVSVFPGNYEDYLWRKENGPIAESRPLPGPTLDDVPGLEKAGRNGRTGTPKRNAFRVRQLRDRCSQLEEQVAEAEADITACETALQTFVNAEETIRLTERLEARRTELSALIAQWEQASTELETNSG